MQKSKVAIVTGASGGIGQAIALRLAKDGFYIVVNYSGNFLKAEETVNRVKAADGQAVSHRGNVADLGDMEALFNTTLDKFGAIDVVVNCAGVMSLSKIEDKNLELFDQVISTNLRGTYIVLGQAAKCLPTGGRIIAVSTSVIAKSLPTYGAYIASKCGVEGLVKVLANELHGRDITVNAVAPGPVATDLFLEGKSQAQIDQLKKMSPLERIGEPEDIAHVVSFLAGPDGSWINGQIIRANGGFA